MGGHSLAGPASIVGLVLLVAGAVLLWLRARKARETVTLQSVAVAGTADVARGQPGSQVAVEGTIACEAPLVGPFSSKLCVYYSETVEDQWEETKRDADGNDTTEQRSSTVSAKTEHAPFQIGDASGTIRILPEKANITAPETYRRKEMMRVGFRAVDRIFQERALEVGKSAYVLGVLQADGTIGMPSGPAKQLFIIDHRKREDRLTANMKALTIYKWTARAVLLVGVVLVVVQVLA